MTRQRLNPAAVRARLAVVLDDVVSELSVHGEVLIRVDRDGDFYVDRADDIDR